MAVYIYIIYSIGIQPTGQALTKPSRAKSWIKHFYRTRTCFDCCSTFSLSLFLSLSLSLYIYIYAHTSPSVVPRTIHFFSLSVPRIIFFIFSPSFVPGTIYIYILSFFPKLFFFLRPLYQAQAMFLSNHVGVYVPCVQFTRMPGQSFRLSCYVCVTSLER